MSYNLSAYNMQLNSNDIIFILSDAEELRAHGYSYAAFPVLKVCTADDVEFFRNARDAEEHCFIMTDGAEFWKSQPIASLINDLRTVMQCSKHNLINEVFDLGEAALQQREKKELLENNLNTKEMNQKNLDFLKDQLKYTGFGETHEGVLKQNLEKGEKEFTIAHEAKFGNDDVKAELHFKRSDQSDMYFFNSYKVNLQKEGPKDGLEHTFYINKDNNVTMKEAYNLMEGRAVNKDLKNKEGEEYNCWMKIDFKSADEKGNFKVNFYHQNYGYDLEASLSKHPIKELGNADQKEALLASLKKGNVQSVVFVSEGIEKKQFVEANPHFKTINVYDGSMQRINTRESRDQKQGESEGKSNSKDQKQKVDSDADSPQSGNKENSRKKKQTNSI